MPLRPRPPTAGRLQTASRSRPIAPGVTLTSFDRYGPDPYSGRVTWLRGDAIIADLTKGATVDYLFPGRVAAAEPLSVQADRMRAVAAVNGDFFDINNSNAPHSTGVQSGQTIVSPGSGRYNAAVITPDGLGRIAQVVFTGVATLPGGRTVPLTQANNHAIDPNGVGVFTSLWGTYPRARAVEGAARVAEVVVTDNVVTSVAPAAGAGPIPDDTFVLLGRDAAADALASLAVGDRVTVSYETRTRGRHGDQGGARRVARHRRRRGGAEAPGAVQRSDGSPYLGRASRPTGRRCSC